MLKHISYKKISYNGKGAETGIERKAELAEKLNKLIVLLFTAELLIFKPFFFTQYIWKTMSNSNNKLYI